MRKLPAIFLLLILLTMMPAGVRGADLDVSKIEDKINSIVHYAEEYEVGNINYLQLNVYGHKIRSDLNLLLGGSIGEEWGRIPKENVENIFGLPVDYTNWVWVDNKHMEKRLNESLPWWERIIFDGRKVQIIFHAFPSAIELENGEMFKYYSVDLNVKFKKKFDFDFNSMLSDVTTFVIDYNMTRTRKAGEALVRKMLEAERLWGSYLQENIEQCTDIVDSFFRPEEKWPNEKTMRWRFSLYKGTDFDVIADFDMCEECEWHHASMNFWVEGRGPMFIFKSPELQWGKLEHQIDEEYFWTLSIDELNEELEKTISEIRDEAEKFDRTRSEDFPKKFFFNRFKIEQINRILDGKYNEVGNFERSIARRIESGELQGLGQCKNLDECRRYCEKDENRDECRRFTYNLRVDAIEKMFIGYEIEKNLADRVWWERRLAENFETRQESWCRHLNDVQCNENEGCVDGKCTLALKVNETCNNGMDDDGDNVADCQDPDCWQEKQCETEYVCNGVKQKKPCEIYICNGREYTKPCDEINVTCGKNQVLDGNDCVCREGFKDCDNDGNCESTRSCGLEICDDIKDNNNDGLVDCMDAKCDRQVCSFEDSKEFLCIAKNCISPEEEIIEEPKPICGNHILEEGESEESCPKDYVVCEAHKPPECPDGKIVWKGRDQLGCSLQPVCVVTEKACEFNADCPQPKCGISQCVFRECKVTELTTDCEEGCEEGKTKKRECKDGSEITTAVCTANEWVKTGYDCPEASIILPVIRPEENITEEEIPKAAEEIAPEVEEEPAGFMRECILANDCGDPQDVCSNGNCITLPILVEEKVKEIKEKAPQGQSEVQSESSEKPPEKSTTSQPESSQVAEAPEQSQSLSETTGKAVAGFTNFITGQLTGLLTGENSCSEECNPCEECNQELDNLMKRIESGELTGPNNCRSRFECDQYCQKEENKEECNTFFRGYGLETYYCWWDLCRDCDRCKFNIGEFTCNANQYFDMEEGFCKCNDGWYECDGDWENGCESSQTCGSCQTKSDCATDRCAPWGNVIQQFDCFKGEERIEERGVVRVLGDCRFFPTRRTEGSVSFDMWGDPFEALRPIGEEVKLEMGEAWCEWELENNIKERTGIQNSFTEASLKWFFEEYIPSSPSEWEKHIGGIYDSYWRIVNNNERTAQMLLCTGRDKLPEEYKPMDVSYGTGFGSVRIWEVETTTEFYGKRMKILSPYMQIWVFPPKDFIKKEFQDGMESGLMPGPEGKKSPELSPSEIEEMRKDKKLMDLVNSISGKYGGEAKFLLNIVDGEELVFNALITINPEILIRFEPMKTYEGDYDAKITFDFDFFYSLISTTEKEMMGGQIEYPPWEREGLKIKDMIKGVVDGTRMLVMISSGVIGGNIQAEPFTSLSDGLAILQMMFERGPQ